MSQAGRVGYLQQHKAQQAHYVIGTLFLIVAQPSKTITYLKPQAMEKAQSLRLAPSRQFPLTRFSKRYPNLPFGFS